MPDPFRLSDFHAFTDVDTASTLAGRGKKTGWETWKNFLEGTDALQELLVVPKEFSEEDVYWLDDL